MTQAEGMGQGPPRDVIECDLVIARRLYAEYPFHERVTRLVQRHHHAGARLESLPVHREIGIHETGSNAVRTQQVEEPRHAAPVVRCEDIGLCRIVPCLVRGFGKPPGLERLKPLALARRLGKQRYGGLELLRDGLVIAGQPIHGILDHAAGRTLLKQKRNSAEEVWITRSVPKVIVVEKFLANRQLPKLIEDTEQRFAQVGRDLVGLVVEQGIDGL